jgi:hypothetical protein
MNPSPQGLNGERGAAILLVVASLVGLMGMAALAIDMGYLLWVRTKLQATADAASLAAAHDIPSEFDARETARDYVAYNLGDASTLSDEGVVIGSWNSGDNTFTPQGSPTNAVQVTVGRTASGGNAVGLWFARVLGIQEADVTATATAVQTGGGPSRFLIDEEMIDTDVRAIEQLAARRGVKTDDLLADKNGDWFIDLPAGEVLELPTGQVGDEGLFDIGHPAFPFNSSSNPSFVDFLNYNEDSNSWRYSTVPKHELDPLVGVMRVDDRDRYPDYVGGGCQVSPVWKSDISALNPVHGDPAVNALGWRRGLLAFKILAVGRDPDGVNGSVLPNLVIEICPPMPLDGPVFSGSGGRISLVS